MNSQQRNAIVISASSDIGAELCKKWHCDGWNILGSYRTHAPLVDDLTNSFNIKMIHCDLLQTNSILSASQFIKKEFPQWDVLVLAPGRQEPVGDFHKVSFDEWKEGVELNFMQQMRFVHELLPHRNLKGPLEPCVLFFAGGGTNNAVRHYSSYTVSKIALIKMCELLDAEIPDTRFSILGPGWVKTKIHKPTLEAGERLAGENYQKTIYKLNSEDCTPMKQVIASCDWIINTKSTGVKGRNFSAVFDRCGSQELENALENDFNMYKLRRQGNDWKGSL